MDAIMTAKATPGTTITSIGTSMTIKVIQETTTITSMAANVAT